jgi:protein-S-isoprenylcysteine O-methyltransferase Ste14
VNPAEAIVRSPLWSQPPLAIAATLLVNIAFLLIAGAIVYDFARYYRQGRAEVASERSWVETGTMTAFFAVYYVVIRFGVTALPIGAPARTLMIVAGMALIAAGVAVNLWGRVELKSAWANQIKVYEGQELITGGPFRWVRHPLYASLTWVFVGGSLIYANALSLVLTLLVFVPMMYVRARREDAALAGVFGQQYRQYKARTGMFLPRLGG